VKIFSIIAYDNSHEYAEQCKDNFGEYLENRQEMLQLWVDYLDGLKEKLNLKLKQNMLS